MSFSPNGDAHQIALSVESAALGPTAILVSTSRDGGVSWGPVNTLIRDEDGTRFFNDKESVTANPKKAGEAYAVWDRLELPNDNPDANLHTQAFRGPTYFSKTTNGGKSWSSPKQIVSFGSSRKQTIGNQILVDPRHPRTLYNFFDLITPPFGVTAYKVPSGERSPAYSSSRRPISASRSTTSPSSIATTRKARTWKMTRKAMIAKITKLPVMMTTRRGSSRESGVCSHFLIFNFDFLIRG